jgi:hypothetical protein
MKTGKTGTNDAVQRIRRYSGMPSREYESAYGNTRGCYTAKHVFQIHRPSKDKRYMTSRWLTLVEVVPERGFDA